MSESSLSGTDERKFFAVPKCRIQLRVWKLKKVARSSYPPPKDLRLRSRVLNLSLEVRSDPEIRYYMPCSYPIWLTTRPRRCRKGGASRSAVPTCLPPAVSFTPSGHYPSRMGRKELYDFLASPERERHRTALGNCDHLLKRQSPSSLSQPPPSDQTHTKLRHATLTCDGFTVWFTVWFVSKLKFARLNFSFETIDVNGCRVIFQVCYLQRRRGRP